MFLGVRATPILGVIAAGFTMLGLIRTWSRNLSDAVTSRPNAEGECCGCEVNINRSFFYWALLNEGNGDPSDPAKLARRSQLLKTSTTMHDLHSAILSNPLNAEEGLQ